MLTNAEMHSHSPFACLLVGQPTLRRRIKLGTFAAMDQRICASPLIATETGTYMCITSRSPGSGILNPTGTTGKYRRLPASPPWDRSH